MGIPALGTVSAPATTKEITELALVNTVRAAQVLRAVGMSALGTVSAPAKTKEITELAFVNIVRVVQFMSLVSEAARAAPGAGLVLERDAKRRLVQRCGQPGRLGRRGRAHENSARGKLTL